ncbi:MAG: hypothetical protein EZS28_052769 [Streblomastix strix]|uniref:Uncharacterized protein n=1 Tax=Streblomastix strix TaxID=222440 RepID=A0A5J4RVB9_9EUKA|nr:MAG: hypothetical protein EZS28_052769 [Streblomastix strix]
MLLRFAEGNDQDADPYSNYYNQFNDCDYYCYNYYGFIGGGLFGGFEGGGPFGDLTVNEEEEEFDYGYVVSVGQGI